MRFKKETEKELNKKLSGLGISVDLLMSQLQVEVQSTPEIGSVSEDWGDYWDVEEAVEDLLPKVKKEADKIKPQTSTKKKSHSNSEWCPSCGGPISVPGEKCDGCL